MSFTSSSFLDSSLSLSLSLSFFLLDHIPLLKPLISSCRFELDQHAPRLYSIIDTPVAITRDTDNNTCDRVSVPRKLHAPAENKRHAPRTRQRHERSFMRMRAASITPRPFPTFFLHYDLARLRFVIERDLKRLPEAVRGAASRFSLNNNRACLCRFACVYLHLRVKIKRRNPARDRD